MKKLLVAIVVVALMVFAGNSWATTITIDRVAGYYSGNGGEFNVAGYGAATNSLYDNDALVNNRYGVQGFESFCLETDEYVAIPGTYNAVLNPNNQAVGGGANTNSGDTISVGTAYLYSLFAAGNLNGYDYTPGAGRVASAANLQNTIWYLEGEIASMPAAFQGVLVANFGNTETAWKADAPMYSYGVGVLNVTTLTGGLAQDQLVLATPIPGALWLLGSGLLGLVAVRRRRK